MKWARYIAACMGEMRSTQKILVRKPEGTDIESILRERDSVYRNYIKHRQEENNKKLFTFMFPENKN
jgi:hypothetical protein